MPDPEDFLPAPPPYLPIPRGLIQDELPPTPRQIRAITVLCLKLGSKEPLEEEVRTMGEAGRLIRELGGRRK